MPECQEKLAKLLANVLEAVIGMEWRGREMRGGGRRGDAQDMDMP